MSGLAGTGASVGSVRVWEKMDATIDSDPRIAACHPHEAACLAIYLFILRRGRLDGHPGKVKPRSLEIHFLSRMTFLPADVLRDALVELLRNELIAIWRDGAVYDVQLRNVAQNTSSGVARPVTEVVTEAISDSEFVLIVGWEGYASRPETLGPKTAGQLRNERYRKRQQKLAKVGAKLEREAARHATRLQTREQMNLVTGSADGRMQTASVDASSDGREIDRIDRERDQISLVPDSSGTGENRKSESDSSTGKTKARLKADKIPERCYRAADYLRDMVLARNPEANIGRRPWDGQRRPPNVHAKPPPDPLRRQGHRLKWADTIRLIVENDGRTYERLTEVIKWLWISQPARLGTGFIVESPESLREKWGAITMHMNGRAPTGDIGGVDRAVSKLEEAIASQQRGSTEPSDDGDDA